MGQILLAVGTGFLKGLANSSANEAYEQEVHNHPDENVATHVAHTIGNVIGQIVSGS